MTKINPHQVQWGFGNAYGTHHKLIHIVAASADKIIGIDGDMPWGRIPGDLPRFKRITTHHPLIMGRKTLESLPGILPNRIHGVLTRQAQVSYGGQDIDVVEGGTLVEGEDLIFANSIEELLNHDLLRKHPDIYIAGGGEIYAMTAPYVHQVRITRIHQIFPDIEGERVLYQEPWLMNSEAWHCHWKHVCYVDGKLSHTYLDYSKSMNKVF